MRGGYTNRAGAPTMPPSPLLPHPLSTGHDRPRAFHRRVVRRGPRRLRRAGARLAAGAAQGQARAWRARDNSAMTPKRKRLWLLVGSLAVLGVAAALVLTALNDNIVFFYSPTQAAEK